MLKLLGFRGRKADEIQISGREGYKWVWVDIFSPEKEEIQEVSKAFSIPLDDLEEMLDLEEVPRMEREKDYTALFFKIPVSGDIVSTMAAILGKGYLITFHKSKAKTAKRAFSRAKRNPPKGPWEAVKLILEEAVDHYERIDDVVERRLDRLEEEIIKGKLDNVAELYRWRERLGELYRALLLNKSVLSEMKKQGRIDVDDIYYDTVQLIEFFSSHKEFVVNLIGLHMNIQNIRLQEVMKFLASITFLAAIPTIISSIYGMNFHYLPLSYHPLGFWLMLGLMLAFMLGGFAYFKRKGWV